MKHLTLILFLFFLTSCNPSPEPPSIETDASIIDGPLQGFIAGEPWTIRNIGTNASPVSEDEYPLSEVPIFYVALVLEVPSGNEASIVIRAPRFVGAYPLDCRTEQEKNMGVPVWPARISWIYQEGSIENFLDVQSKRCMNEEIEGPIEGIILVEALSNEKVTIAISASSSDGFYSINGRAIIPVH